MDLNQSKLSRDEWNNIEKPINPSDLKIVEMIINGYNDITIKMNNSLSLLNYLKITNTDSIDLFVYIEYLQQLVMEALNYNKKGEANQKKIVYNKLSETKCTIKKVDKMRFKNTNHNMDYNKYNIYEFMLIELLRKMVKEREKESKKYVLLYYTIYMLTKNTVENLNNTLISVLKNILEQLKDEIDIKNMVFKAQDLIEKNANLLKYADDELYEHQKRLFTCFKQSKTPQLVLYIAPTGTGKTLSPLGLTSGFRVIFVCAARHVGLALAKAAISANRKVAFAFGCNDAEDIRLHYFAAKECKRNKKSGAISKVDNTVGDLVEIMISDIKSYIPAMNYMIAFNDKRKIITYWDEPTITMDYDEHEFHEIIHNNWKNNIIPNMVLSSATLPQEDEMRETIQDFKARFEDAEVNTIVSHDCKKTIPLINQSGYIEMPHYMFESYDDILDCVSHSHKYKTLMRYIDLGECVDFIKVIHKKFKESITKTRYLLERNFTSVECVNMTNIKLYYLDLLGNLKKENWDTIYKYFVKNREKRLESNIYITTTDAHTLTDGPTIFLADDVDKMAKFCIQSADIPNKVMIELMEAINYNSVINEKIANLNKDLEDMEKKDEGKENKLGDEGRGNPEAKKLRKKINDFQMCVKTVALNPQYVPNLKEHLHRFAPKSENKEKVFKCNISEDVVEKIMLIDDVEDFWKLLLMMGIGVFSKHNSVRYMEVMKQLAQEQKLYLIIASTDYIYGTNYQFCHGYISKDLTEMSQEKAIQAMGRVGRNKLQYDYSLRFRDDSIIYKLFKKDDNKPEVRNMARLFNS